MRCAGEDFYGHAANCTGRYVVFSTGETATCGLTTRVEFECWGVPLCVFE